MIIYFSGTGNSRYCAELLAQSLGDDCVSSGELIRSGRAEGFASRKPWVFVCPTYAWQIPHIFEAFIEKSDFSGSKKAYFVMSCGGEIGSPQAQLLKLCEKKDFEFMGVFEILMPENYLAMFSVPPEDEILEVLGTAPAEMQRAADFIEKSLSFPPHKTWLLDKLKSGGINSLFYKFIIKTSKFHAKDSCISCEKCKNLCPLNNISMVSGKPLWGDSCTHCMACISYCPTEAIEYGKKSVGQLRYTAEKFKN